ncbi:MAG: hypothetical protein VSS75_010195 [Candidatus Parabeggiatoa sp.]|nr:hypothetical protein [Candidatus Parabeggiatoa sp.]
MALTIPLPILWDNYFFGTPLNGWATKIQSPPYTQLLNAYKLCPLQNKLGLKMGPLQNEFITGISHLQNEEKYQ